MKVLQAGLNLQAPVTVYDKTKPTINGRVFSKTLAGQTVLGPPLATFTNTFQDAGIAPTASRTTPNGRQFQLLSVTGGIATIALYDVDLTGQVAPAYVGKIQVLLANAAATTHSLKYFDVYDGPNAGTVTGWQIYIGTTGSVLINGGLFMANSIARADFSPLSPPTIGMAIANNAKAVYMLQDPGSIGVANTLTALQGGALDRSTRRLYFHNNVLATTQWAVFDPSVSPAVAPQTTTAATVNATPTFTLTGHGYAANDPVVITANAPTGFTASVANAAQTVYFVRNPTANTFELSATSGGASINATSVTSSTVVMRAFGQSTSAWLSIRTGTVTGFIGTFLLTNCESIVTPSQALDPLIPSAVNGQTCLFVSTTTNNYLIKVSEITNGATTFPTMVTVNNQGTGTDYTAILSTYALYSEVTGRIIIVSNTTQFYLKRWVNNVIDTAFGAVNTTYLENVANPPYTFSGVTLGNLEERAGWLYYVASTTGQRGVLSLDMRSDLLFGYSYITSPVVDTSDVLRPRGLRTVESLYNLTSVMGFSYKTAATAADAIFNSPTTGWTTIAASAELSSLSFNNFTQFRVDFDIIMGNNNTPCQLNELYISYDGKTELSDYWALDGDTTTQGTGSPSYVTFVLKKAYTGSVPTLFLRGFDAAGNQNIATLDTVTNVGVVSNSTNSGTSFSAGVGPNTVGTLLRFLIASPPGARAYLSLKES